MNVRLLFDVLRTLRRFRQHDLWARTELEAYQNAALESLREWAYGHSRFYREFHRSLLQAPLQDLPVLTKTTMMEHFEALVTDPSLRLSEVRAHLTAASAGRFRNTYEVVATSGSTGNPGIFLFDSTEWSIIMASFARAREWAGLRLNPFRCSRMAVVSSTNERNVSARVGKAADTPFLPTLRLDATQPLPEIVAALNTWGPEVLVAYASMAHCLALEQLAGRLAIHPRAVFTSSEVLTAGMRRRLVDVWGDVVFDEYASTETATIAAEDTSHHGLHLFEDLLIVENVDADNRPVSPGAFGNKLLVTVLFIRTQPLIRYEISDSVRFAIHPPTCRLPFRTIDGVQGRREDVLIFRGATRAPVQVHPNVFHDVMDAIPSNGWQIIQEADALKALIVASAGTPDASAVRAKITATLSDRGVAVPAVYVEHVDAIPKAASGKTPLIKAYRPRGE